MEFQLRLKRKNLLDLIAYIKLSRISNKAELEDDGKLTSTDLEYKEHSLFHGLMSGEQAETRKISAFQTENMPEIVSRLSRAFNSAVQAYNPRSSNLTAGLEVTKVWS